MDTRYDSLGIQELQVFMQFYFEAIEFDPIRAAKNNMQDILLSIEVDKFNDKLGIK